MESNNQDNFLKQFGTIDSLSCYGLEKKKKTPLVDAKVKKNWRPVGKGPCKRLSQK
jgi:hypothetical protein